MATRWNIRRRSALATALAVALAAAIGMAASAVGAAQVTPPVPAGLPATIEGLARYVPANSCDPTLKPGTTRLGDLLTATYPGTSYQITRTCGTDALPTSEHYDGRALDWLVSARVVAQRAKARALLSWLLRTDTAGHAHANARRLGVMYIIWNNRIWGSYRAAEGWRAYASCASRPSKAFDTTCHRNHVHVSLSWEGAMGRTSYWTGRPAAPDYGPCRVAGLNWAAPYRTLRSTPCVPRPKVVPMPGASALDRTLTTYSGMRVARGSTGPVVRAVQQAVGAPVTGTFGALSLQALRAWQGSHGLAVSGVVDVPTWRALLRANAPAA